MTSPTTYAAFTAALAALTVTGVTRKFANPPAAVDTADLPALWPGLPSGTEPLMTFATGSGTSGGWPAMRCDLIVALEPVGQNTQAANYAATVAMLDNLSSTLRGNHIGRGPMTWAITANVQINVSGNLYWAVIATIEIR
jgi:hypothetical protein